MGLVYLEHAITMRKADALSIHDNFIAECGSCIELLDWGQASKVTDNLIGAGPHGHSIYTAGCSSPRTTSSPGVTAVFTSRA